jgi:hypothetical protein
MKPDIVMPQEEVRDINLKESLLLLFFLRNDNRPAYAAQIERELPELGIIVGWPEGGKVATITRRWAKKICERLEKAGVMESILRRTKRQKNLSKYYFLRSDLESFRWIFGRVAPLYGGLLISSGYAQEIIEKQLIEDLEKRYDTKFDRETKSNIIVALFLSTSAVELALGDLALPPTKHSIKSKQGREELNDALLSAFHCALFTDIVRFGLAWRRGKLDEIEFSIDTRLRKGDVEASISSNLRFKSDLDEDIISVLRVGSS